jgi:hypothetical protein
MLIRNKISGQVSNQIDPSFLEHPHFKDILEEVPDGTKSYVEGMFRQPEVVEDATPKTPTPANIPKRTN